jgi:hypothetical protein
VNAWTPHVRAGGPLSPVAAARGSRPGGGRPPPPHKARPSGQAAPDGPNTRRPPHVNERKPSERPRRTGQNGETGGRRPAPPFCDGYAQVCNRITLGLARCSHCHVLYTLLDGKLGGQPGWFETVARVGKALGWWPKTVNTHAKHLHDAGLIEVTECPGSNQLRLRHSPARGLVNRGVKLSRPTPPTRRARPHDDPDQIAARVRDGGGGTPRQRDALCPGAPASARRGALGRRSGGMDCGGTLRGPYPVASMAGGPPGG